jgi:hypothetical protein
MQDEQQRQARGSVARRGVLAGLVALVAGALAKASERVAQAGDGSTLVLGSNANQANNETVLTRGSGTPPATGFAFQVFGAGNAAAIYGHSSSIGVEGSSTGTTGLSAGVYGANGLNANSPQLPAGVHGTSLDHPGVFGYSESRSGVEGRRSGGFVPSGYSAGVLGAAPSGVTGVQGIADSPGPIPPQGTAGVGGTRSSGYGVVGSSSSNVGVYGLSTSGSGALGQSNSGVGVQGSSNGNVGVLGTSAASVGVYANSIDQYGLYATSPNNFAAIGTSNTGTGVYGSSNGNVGVQGSSNSSIGGFFSSGTSTGLYATGPASGFAARFDGPVQVNGPFTVLGGPKSAAVPHPDGSHRRLYCVESPESWFEDFGQDQVVNGRGRVQLDPDFDALVRGDNYQVFLTPYGDTKGLYVSDRRPHGFDVREVQGGTGTLAFGYRVVAKRKDIAGPRLERVEIPGAPQRPAAPQPPPQIPTLDRPRIDPNAAPVERRAPAR